MGKHQPLWDPANLADHQLPRFEDHRFRSPDDVIDWARRDNTIGWKTWPEVWHLDGDGAFRCGYRASSLDNIQRWADNPYGLLRSRWEGVADSGCAPNWLVIETRQPYHEVGTPTEADAKAFLDVRDTMRTVGVTLIDVMIFDDDFHVWSLHDLESPGQPYELGRDDA